jgi:D-proline reductase (dithiol) PrdB
LARLIELELDGFIGECADRHYSMMGYVPEVKPILETVVQKVTPALQRSQVDAVVVSGGCELSHQSAGLIQREIEAVGIPTVAVSVCFDITNRLQVPRAVALRFPLGNPFGAPLDNATQSRILRDALSLLETARGPGEILKLPYDWIKT